MDNKEEFIALEGTVAPKPGWKTSELYVIVGGTLLTLAVGTGWLSTEQAQTVKDATAQTVDALTRLATALAPLAAAIAYTWSRTRVKAE